MFYHSPARHFSLPVTKFYTTATPQEQTDDPALTGFLELVFAEWSGFTKASHFYQDKISVLIDNGQIDLIDSGIAFYDKL